MVFRGHPRRPIRASEVQQANSGPRDSTHRGDHDLTVAAVPATSPEMTRRGPEPSLAVGLRMGSLRAVSFPESSHSLNPPGGITNARALLHSARLLAT